MIPHETLCVVSLIGVGFMTATTIYFAHGKLKAYRQQSLWMNTAHRMQRAAALDLPSNHHLVSAFNGLYDAALAGTEAEARL